MSKWCYVCEQTLSVENFYKNKTTTDGLQSECKKCRKAELTTEKGRERRRKAAKIQRAKHPDRERARTALRHAVGRGRLVKQPCQYCGDPKSQGHHEDYNKPLEVIWVCDTCHKAIFHRRNQHESIKIVPLALS